MKTFEFHTYNINNCNVNNCMEVSRKEKKNETMTVKYYFDNRMLGSLVHIIWRALSLITVLLISISEPIWNSIELHI